MCRNIFGSSIYFTFRTYKILDQNEEILRISPNIFAQIILIVYNSIKNKKASELTLYEIRKKLAIDLLAMSYPSTKIRSLMNFLTLTIELKNEDLIRNLELELNVLTKNKKNMGLEELIKTQIRIEAEAEGMQIGERKGWKLAKRKVSKKEKLRKNWQLCKTY